MATPRAKPNDATASLSDSLPSPKNDQEAFAFIREVIRSLVDRQPLVIQAIVLFVFVLLFVYLVVFTFHASMVVTAKVQVALTKEQIEEKRRRGIYVEDTAYQAPELGYHINYNGHSYALNSAGEARIDLSIPMYTWVNARRKFLVAIRTPDSAEYSRPLTMDGLTLGSIQFRGVRSAGPRTSWTEPPTRYEGGHSLSQSFSYVSTAEARPVRSTERRLYIQSITAGPAAAANVRATLVVGTRKYPLRSAADDSPAAKSDDSIAILIKGGSSTVQDYSLFFSVEARHLSLGGYIDLEERGFLGGSYSERFPLPTNLSLGPPQTVKGVHGGIMAVQVTYPIDVVFFERRDTPDVTESLVSRLTEMGYVARVNRNAANIKGTYNVVYSGVDVPTFALRRVLDVLSKNEIAIRHIQPKTRLSSGRQYQIQVGSNAKFGCLPAVDLKRISQPNDDLYSRIAELPQPGSCVGG
jgi:hypothetical protein